MPKLDYAELIVAADAIIRDLRFRSPRNDSAVIFDGLRNIATRAFEQAARHSDILDEMLIGDVYNQSRLSDALAALEKPKDTAAKEKP